MKKILLIEPPLYRLYKNTYSLDRYPHSLGYLAGAIKKNTDWDVMVYNADFSPRGETIHVSYLAGAGFDNYLENLRDRAAPIWSEIKAAVLDYKPDVVGISVKSQNYASACNVAGIVKAVDKNITVIGGGPHPSMVGAALLDCPDFDIGVKGEGENTIVELLRAVDGGKEYDGIAGIFYKKDGKILTTPPRAFIEDLDALDFPHRAAPAVLKDYHKYPLTVFKYIFGSRGCPYDCFFCGSRNIWSRKVRFRSPENVAREIESLQKSGLQSVHFDDDTFGINKKYIHDLCREIIRRCPGIKWSCETHVKLVDEDTVALMKSAGCYLIQVGIESGSNEMLKKIRKGITIEEALNACRIIKSRGIDLQAFFIVGFPEETEETLNETIAAMKKVKCDILTYSIFTPYPGTEAFDFCREKGLLDDTFNASLYNHQSPANCFCMNIQPARFREIASKVEKMVDRHNQSTARNRILSLNDIWRIKELGLGQSVRKGLKILFGK